MLAPPTLPWQGSGAAGRSDPLLTDRPLFTAGAAPMHARFAHRRLVISGLWAILTASTSVGGGLRAEELARGAGTRAVEITIAPQHSRLIGRRATQQLIATARLA